MLRFLKSSLLVLTGVSSTAAPAGALFPIRVGGAFGFIDRAGKVVIEPRFARVGDFQDGLCLAWIGAEAGYIDTRGEFVIPPQFTTAGDFHEDRALVSKDGRYRVINRRGETVAEIPYRVMGEFSGGLARVQRPRQGSVPSAYGYIDRQGRVAIEPQFMPASDFPPGAADLAVGGLDRDWCYFDRTGKIILRLPMEGHDRAPGFHDGLLRWKETFYWGYRDASGAWAIEPKFDDALDFENGRARVELEGKWITIDTRGRPLEPAPGPQPAGPPSEGLTRAVDGDRTGYLLPGGKPAFPFRKYDAAFDFSGGRARIKLDGRFGYLDRDGRLAIRNEFSSAADFKNGLAAVLTAQGPAYIDTSGKIVWLSPLP